jgi:hypothetical protein
VENSDSADDQDQKLEQIGCSAVALKRVDRHEQNSADEPDYKRLNENRVHAKLVAGLNCEGLDAIPGTPI